MLPTQVLETALARIRTERTAFRAKSRPLEQLFTPEELAELQDAFEAANIGGRLTCQCLRRCVLVWLCRALWGT